MKSFRFSFFILLLCLLFSGFRVPPAETDGWTPLFNGKDLSGWDTFLGPEFDASGNKVSEKPVGLNRDPRHVFSIVTDGAEKVIRISGESFGAISTEKEFENYHLRLMFKWGSAKWIPKKDKKRDSGLLYHSVGAQGADFGFWMRSQEFQIEEGNCGDYWGVAGGREDIPAIKKTDSEFVFNPQGTRFTFSANSPSGRRCIKLADAEKPSGEWNTLELFIHGDTSVHVVNGKTVMVLYHSSQWENGKALPLVKGKLQIQSEGAEVFYKQIQIRPLDAIPPAMLK